MADCTSIDNTVQLYAGHCRGGFDFPLLFEESILVLLPIVLAVLIAAATFPALLRSPVTTASPWLGAVKTVRNPVLPIETPILTLYLTGLLDMRCGFLLRTGRRVGYSRIN